MFTLANLLTFHIDKQLYALDVEPVEQIVSMVTITPIPQATNIAEGIINVHGEAVPVVDLRRHLNSTKREYHFHTPIILIKINDRLVGLIVDNVSDVVSLQEPLMVHPKEILPEEMCDISLLSGVAYTPEGAVFLLDPDQLFQPDQLQMLAEVSKYFDELVSSGKLEDWPQPEQ